MSRFFPSDYYKCPTTHERRPLDRPRSPYRVEAEALRPPRRPKPLTKEFILWATDAYLDGLFDWKDFNDEQKDAVDDELWLRKRHRHKAREKEAQEEALRKSKAREIEIL